MPRGNRSSGGRSAPRAAPVPHRSAPQPQRAPSQVAHPPASTPMPMQAPMSGGGGLFGQMAATAGGVAIGSAVGHVIGNAMTGGGGAAHPYAEPVLQQQQEPAVSQPVPQQQQYSKACEFELQQFLECAKTNDLAFCEGLNNVLKECRMRYGI